MTQAAKNAVNAIMGVIGQQTGSLSAQDNYDTLDELADLVADKFATAKEHFSQIHPKVIGIDRGVSSGDTQAPGPSNISVTEGAEPRKPGEDEDTDPGL